MTSANVRKKFFIQMQLISNEENQNASATKLAVPTK